MSCEAVIGLEVHVQLATRTKIFCSCPAVFGALPNTRTCPVCLGLPGALPVLNTHAVELALLTACATGCRIAPVSFFARKQYFYPDLPKGYQITQYDQPLAVDGFLEIDLCPHEKRRIGIERIHLEEDAGRLLHNAEGGWTCIDYNRAGVPLIEVVSTPDMRSPEEAGAYLRGLHRLVQYLGVCQGYMEQGAFRCDANVSIRPERSSQAGTRVELKNLNSFRQVEKALAHEIRRQKEVVDTGSSVAFETRLWDDTSSKSVVMRDKEDACDYRYFPEPDLPPLVIDREWYCRTAARMPELPRAKKQRFSDRYALSDCDAEFLTRKRQSADYFEETVSLGADPKQVCNWIMGEVSRRLDDMSAVQEFAVTPVYLAELIRLVAAGIINKNTAKAVFDKIVVTGLNPCCIVEADELSQISGADELEALVSQVLEQYPDEVARFRSGRKELLDFFVGSVMKQAGGRADPGHVNQIVRSKLDEQSH